MLPHFRPRKQTKERPTPAFSLSMAGTAHAGLAPVDGTAMRGMEIACVVAAASVYTAANPAFPFASARRIAIVTAITTGDVIATGATADRKWERENTPLFFVAVMLGHFVRGGLVSLLTARSVEAGGLLRGAFTVASFVALNRVSLTCERESRRRRTETLALGPVFSGSASRRHSRCRAALPRLGGSASLVGARRTGLDEAAGWQRVCQSRG